MSREVARPGYTAPTAYATWPYWLSLIGGILILIDGIVLAIAGPFLLAFGAGAGAVVLGILGVIFGVIVIWAAYRLRSNMAAHVTYGAVIVVFSVLALILTGGGFVIGSILGIIGGIWAFFVR